MKEENFTCWYEGQSEGDGKDIKASHPEAAARLAVDIWRHENIRELKEGQLVVYLKNEKGLVRKMVVKAHPPLQEPRLHQ
jgi:hypothetical protein